MLDEFASFVEDADQGELEAYLRETGVDTSSKTFLQSMQSRMAKRYDQIGITEKELNFYSSQRGLRRSAHVRTSIIGEIVQFVESLMLGQIVRPLAVVLSAFLELTVFYQGAGAALGTEQTWLVAATSVIITLFYLSMSYSLAEATIEKKPWRERLLYGGLVSILGLMMLWFGSIGRIGPERLDALGSALFGLPAPANLPPLTASVYIEVIGLAIMSAAFLVAETVSVHVLYSATRETLKKDALAEISRVNPEEIRLEVLKDLAWTRARRLEKSRMQSEKETLSLPDSYGSSSVSSNNNQPQPSQGVNGQRVPVSQSQSPNNPPES